MHIVYTCATYHPHTGGAESAIEDLAAALVNAGHRVTVITRRSPQSLPARERHRGVDILRLRYPPPDVRNPWHALRFCARSLAVVAQLFAFARRERVQVVCVGLVGMDSAFAWILRAFLACRLVVYLHGGELRAYVRVSWFVRRVLRRCLRSCEAVVAVSAALRREVAAFAPGVEAKVTVIPNAVEPMRICNASPHRHGRRYILYAGRLHRVKDVTTLIHAFRRSAPQLPDVDLLLAGAGPEASSLRQLVHAHGLADRVTFLGSCSRHDVASLIRGCELLVLPSLAEGLPVVVLEALAAGKMTIASRVKGTTEVIEDGVNGALFAAGDEPALSALITRYAGAPAARAAIEANIRAAGAGRYDVTRLSAEHLAVYGLGQRLRLCLVSLFYFQDPACTGLSAYYFNLRQSLATLGHTVYLVTAADGAADDPPGVIRVPPSHADLLEPASDGSAAAGLRRSIKRLAFAARAYRQVRALDETVGLDAVIAPELFAQGLFIALGMGRKLLTRIHTPTYIGDTFNQRYRAAWVSRVLSLPEKLQVGRSRAASVASLHMRRIVCRDWGLAESAIPVIPNSVQIAWVRSLAAAQPRRIAGDYLLFVGRLERRKGAEVIMAALPSVFACHPTIKMVFAGPDRGWGERLRRAAAPHEERISLLGPLDKAELFGVMRDAVLIVLPSLVENLSNVGLEAMALGRPVLGTYDTAFEEIIADADNGFLVPPGSASALSEKILACLGTSDLDAVGARALESVRAFDSAVVAQQYESLCRQAILG